MPKFIHAEQKIVRVGLDYRQFCALTTDFALSLNFSSENDAIEYLNSFPCLQDWLHGKNILTTDGLIENITIPGLLYYFEKILDKRFPRLSCLLWNGNTLLNVLYAHDNVQALSMEPANPTSIQLFFRVNETRTLLWQGTPALQKWFYFDQIKSSWVVRRINNVEQALYNIFNHIIFKENLSPRFWDIPLINDVLSGYPIPTIINSPNRYKLTKEQNSGMLFCALREGYSEFLWYLWRNNPELQAEFSDQFLSFHDCRDIEHYKGKLISITQIFMLALVNNFQPLAEIIWNQFFLYFLGKPHLNCTIPYDYQLQIFALSATRNELEFTLQLWPYHADLCLKHYQDKPDLYGTISTVFLTLLGCFPHEHTSLHAKLNNILHDIWTSNKLWLINGINSLPAPTLKIVLDQLMAHQMCLKFTKEIIMQITKITPLEYIRAKYKGETWIEDRIKELRKVSCLNGLFTPKAIPPSVAAPADGLSTAEYERLNQMLYDNTPSGHL
ncbi:hypothetical protein ACFORL_10580 [Legionella dresdenensis]|uniref:Uncharacterized protein n=1 Tax=Legionella dresdenensis TaxID=450200 RepID=A0ABV8CGT5_9GAMM